MISLGKILIKSRYGIFSGAPSITHVKLKALKLKYIRDDIYIRSTDFDRTIQSAEANMQGRDC